MRRVLGALTLAVLLAIAAAGQMQDGYLDVYIAKVKPEKRAEFDAAIKKFVDANRRHKGDTWTASETIYGEQNTVYFTSLRRNYAEAGQGFDAFFGALNKAYGPAGAAKVWQDGLNCVTSLRAEVRQRRMDLSWNVPSDQAALFKLVGESRWTRTILVRVRPGRTGQYVEQIKAIKAAFEKTGSQPGALVSQSASGQQGTVFYITALRSSLGGFDPSGPSLTQAMGAEGFQRYQKAVQELVLTSETYINRYLPELSNPPEEVVAASPGFWRPKPAPAAKAKAKPAEGAKPQ